MMNKKLMLAFIFIFFIIGVLAIWIVSIKSSATYDIYSQEYGGLSIVQDLSGGSFNSLNQTIFNSDEFVFDYSGEEGADVDINIVTLKQDVVDNCTSWENDCDVSYTHHYSFDSSNLNEGSNIKIISPGQQTIQFNISCVQYACPQIITPTIEVTKVES